MFVVIGQKEKDCYVIQDMREGMGGKCCCTRYTMQQLINKGYKVVGAKINNGKLTSKDVIVCNLDGTPANKINSYPTVADTKRSATTIEKGIKLTRAEIKAKKEATAKRKATIKENKRVAKEEKLAKEKEEKNRLAKLKREESLIKKLKKRIQKSKPLFILQRIKQNDGEYHGNNEYIYRVELRSAASITKFMKGLLHGDFKVINACADSSRELNSQLRRNRIVRLDVYSEHPFFSNELAQVVADKNSVIFEYSQEYEDYQFAVKFSGIKKEATLIYKRHCCSEGIESLRYGSTANGKGTINGLRNYILNLGYC